MGGDDELFKTKACAMLKGMPWPDGGLTGWERRTLAVLGVHRPKLGDEGAALATLPLQGRASTASVFAHDGRGLLG